MLHKVPIYSRIVYKLILAGLVLIISTMRFPQQQDVVEQSSLVSADQKPQNGIAIPFSFVPNLGQFDAPVRFQGNFVGGAVSFVNDGLWLAFRAASQKSIPAKQLLEAKQGEVQETHIMGLTFEGANPSPEIVGEGLLPGKVNYFHGNDPAQWRTGISLYVSVVYKQLYPGIDLIYSGSQNSLKGTYQLSPGADPEQIQWRYAGATSLDLESNTGDLSIYFPATSRDLDNDQSEIENTNKLVENAPIAWQEIDGKRISIEVGYVVNEDGLVKFTLGQYNPEYPLTIDPEIIFSTYLGGSIDEYGEAVAVDATGNVYVIGTTNSPDFPLTPGGNPISSVAQEVFVTKLTGSGNTLIFSTFMGGTNNDQGFGIDVDQQGYVYVTGLACSIDFPLVNPIQVNFGGGYSDAFIAKLNPTGDTLLFSTYLGGSNSEGGYGLDVGEAGIVYIGGSTWSSDFPLTVNPIDGVFEGSSEAFITKYDTQSNVVLFSTFIGGSGRDVGFDIAIDDDRDVYLTGDTDSTNFPTHNPIQPTLGGGVCYESSCQDIFLTKILSDGSAYVYSTYLGGGGYADERGFDIFVDDQEYVYILGDTDYEGFPVINPLQPHFGGGSFDLIVAKVNPEGTALVYSTYIGGAMDESAHGIATDRYGITYIGAYVDICIPVVTYEPNTYRRLFVFSLEPDGQKIHNYNYIGGTQGEGVKDIAAGEEEDLALIGETLSSDFPTVNPFDSTYNRYQDIVVIRFSLRPTQVVTSAYMAYLPAIQLHDAPLGIYGYATRYGCGLVGLPVELRFYNGSSWSTLASTTTQIDGLFSFPNVPTLAAGQKYYVRYVNHGVGAHEDWIGFWGTKVLSSYTNSKNVLIGVLNVEGITLRGPGNGNIVTLPTTFQWDKRVWSIDDSYEFNMYDPNKTTRHYYSPKLGYVGSFTINTLPRGFVKKVYYLWYMGVYSPDGGYGTSYYARWVKFVNPPLGFDNFYDSSLEAYPGSWFDIDEYEASLVE